MNALKTAKDLVAARDFAQASVENHLAPFLKDYITLLNDVNPRYFYGTQNQQADTFVEIDGKTFYFTGEEIFEFGEYTTPSLSLPFAFVEDPEAYEADLRQKEADRVAKKEAATKASEAEHIARLEAQLAKAKAKAGL